MDIYKGRHFSKEVIVIAVRWYVAYALSYRDIEELMDERGLKVDHSTLQRWVERYAPEYEKRFRAKNKVPTGSSWRMDETYIKVKGEWYYLYRCVDKEGNTVDFYLSKHRDTKAVKAFMKKLSFAMAYLKGSISIKVVPIKLVLKRPMPGLMSVSKYSLGSANTLTIWSNKTTEELRK